eukprot:Nk52_evm15s967 gene=Nk52_evmTU15s967
MAVDVEHKLLQSPTGEKIIHEGKPLVDFASSASKSKSNQCGWNEAEGRSEIAERDYKGKAVVRAESGSETNYVKDVRYPNEKEITLQGPFPEAEPWLFESEIHVRQVFGNRNFGEVKKKVFYETSAINMNPHSHNQGYNTIPKSPCDVGTSRKDRSKPFFNRASCEDDLQFDFDKGAVNVLSSSTVFPVSSEVYFSVKRVTSIVAIFVISIFLCSMARQLFFTSGAK